MEEADFLQSYSVAVAEGNAALFVGAGLSRPSGFLDWKGLLRDCGRELKLDLDREHDLVAVAQFYLNQRKRDRSRLNQILKREFDRPAKVARNHEIIARLPIRTLWTTNFDTLLEQAFEAAGVRLDVKSRDKDLAVARAGREAVLYKMHGDITRPDEIVICKEDYDRYAVRHPVFQNVLEGDLVDKTFLFLGFSFTDPHLNYMLGHLDALLEESKHEHYAVMRRVRKNDHAKNQKDARDTFKYETHKQQLQIEDLQRYGIQTVLIDEYAHLTDLLEQVASRLQVRNVFVSGSAHNCEEFGDERMRDLCMRLGETLMTKGCQLTCGMGLNIGDAVVKGALVELFNSGQAPSERRLLLRPFPRNLPAATSELDFYRKYRSDMIRQSGVAIFIAGTSRSSPISVGVMEEYRVAKELGKIPIPIGATGFAARKIWQEVRDNLKATYKGRVSAPLFARLGNPKLTNQKIVDAVFEILEAVSKA
jgi:Sir2- and TIR-associating SLOG family/SIR2-like domain